ncbi:hypothetical protein XNW1_4700012 [Xenorhabdus nematophila str. Websteri]|nr:hypothetical protein XNW1_4700012 [Xenorhabdus nematophila str. Websteri]
MLDGIGSGYSSLGIYWLATIIKGNDKINSTDFDENTFF